MRTVDLGPIPGAGVSVAVDARTGHAFVSGFGRVLMLDTRSGKLLRTTRMPNDNTGILVDIGSTGRVFLQTSVGERDLLCVLDATTGRLIRTLPQGETGHIVRAVDERTGARLPDHEWADRPRPDPGQGHGHRPRCVQRPGAVPRAGEP